MNLLLDSHVLLWWSFGTTHLSDEVRALIAEPDNDVHVSAASAWEIGIKVALGRLTIPEPVEAAVAKCGSTPLAITLRHGEEAAALPPHHRDPFDRMLVAQARVEGFKLVTRDACLRAYDVAIVDA